MAKTKAEEPGRSGWREIAGILTGTVGVLMLLAVVVYNPMDITLFCNQPGDNRWVGSIGANLAFKLFMYFGVAGYVIPFGILWIGFSATFASSRRIYPRLLWFLLGLFCLAGLLDMQQIWHGMVQRLNVGSPGGLMGEVLAHRTLGNWIGRVGAGIVFFVLFVLSIIRMLDLRIIDLSKQLWTWIRKLKVDAPTREEAGSPADKPKRKRAARKSRPAAGEKEPLNIQEILAKREAGEATAKAEKPKPVVEKKDWDKAQPKKEEKTKPKKEKEFAASVDGQKHADYQLPSIGLLDPSVPQGKGMSAGEIADTAEVLQSTLEEFGVEARVTGVQQGPVVTCYEIEPAAGVRVERIKALADNIALKMHAESIRIQAPIPGKGVCGVEVPNPSRASVYFRDLVESRKFQQGRQALPLVLGKDVNGESMIYDLAKMPHLLIAGATGSGKSVCMNSILSGLLMKHSPDDLRLILIDPKTVEFQQYNNLPHLVVPVITNPKKVALGLRWAIDEMERRYKWFNQTGVRDLPGFNKRAVQKQEELFGDEVAAGEVVDEKERIPEKLPYIVIVIDELADLMAVAQQDVEAGIARLAAKSRAAGVHMILATQRPDVKVITGTIKANFPVRIAFKVSQGNDSRTILDRIGAEKLLGKGDMLVVPPGSDRHIRAQGAFTSDGEIERIAAFCKDQCKPEFIAEIHEKIEKPTAELPEIDNGGDDEIVEQAVEVIRQTKRASTSSLQRRLRIGYTRAARVMDLLEERGIIGPPEGAGPREILIDLDGEIPQNPGAVKDGTD